MSNEIHVSCPTCEGAKTVSALVNYGPSKGCSWEAVPCITCHGAGSIDEPYAKRLTDGRILRDARLAADKTVKEAATERGMSLRDYVDLEHGRYVGVPA